jgi:hypothetical protein
MVNDNTHMDDKETLHRRARLRELIDHCFNGSRNELVDHITLRTQKRPNEGEISGLKKDNGPRSFGDKKAKVLSEQIGLHRRWFDFPIGTNLQKDQWLADLSGTIPNATPDEIAQAFENGTKEKQEALTLLARLPDSETATLLPLLKSILSKYE